MLDTAGSGSLAYAGAVAEVVVLAVELRCVCNAIAQVEAVEAIGTRV